MKRSLVLIAAIITIACFASSAAAQDAAATSSASGYGSGQAMAAAGNNSLVLISEGAELRREFPNVVQPNQGPTMNTPFMGPYTSGWNVTSKIWEIKTIWTAAELQRVLESSSPKAETRLELLAAPSAIKITEILRESDLAQKNITPQNLAERYDVLGVVYAWAKDGDQCLNGMFYAALKIELDKIGAPNIIVTHSGFENGSIVKGWNLGFGGGTSIISGGPGNIAGNVAGGTGLGEVRAKGERFPYVVLLAVSPKGPAK